MRTLQSLLPLASCSSTFVPAAEEDSIGRHLQLVTASVWLRCAEMQPIRCNFSDASSTPSKWMLPFSRPIAKTQILKINRHSIEHLKAEVAYRSASTRMQSTAVTLCSNSAASKQATSATAAFHSLTLRSRDPVTKQSSR